MALQPEQLHVVFFPFMAASHMMPILDIAKLFAAQHIKTTIITTPMNAPTFLEPLEKSKHIGPPINIEIIPFPSEEVGLPKEVERLDIRSSEIAGKLFKATEMLQQPLEKVLGKYRPHCLVADFLLPFALEAASKFNLPTLVFHGYGSFPLCCALNIAKYEPYTLVATGKEEFVIPDLPHVVKLTILQVSSDMTSDVTPIAPRDIFLRAMQAEKKSLGVILNSFYELEQDYADYYRKVIGRRAWLVGPASLCNQEKEAKFHRGYQSSLNEHECLKWLDSKKPNSVVYVCFGSLSLFSDSQLYEIAMGLEASGQDFIWIVRRSNEEKKSEDWLPIGFEKRVEGGGLLIRGWAPQILILDHEAAGVFVTHCGWNSILEAVSCGIPMVTWPQFAEQFFNEKLVTEILNIGVSMGVKHRSIAVKESVKREDIKEAIQRVMVGEEGLQVRERAKKLKDRARKAMEEHGSSYSDLQSLIQELGSYYR